jgi:hypothetical protein
MIPAADDNLRIVTPDDLARPSLTDARYDSPPLMVRIYYVSRTILLRRWHQQPATVKASRVVFGNLVFLPDEWDHC